MSDYCTGFIVAVKDYREADAILYMLTKEFGMLTCIARGIRKINSKNAAGCQLFTLSKALIHRKEMHDLHLLQSVEIMDNYRHIREDLLRQSIAAYFCELITVGDFKENMFVFLKQCMDYLKDAIRPYTVLCAFQVVINQIHGIEPYVDGCVVCKRSDHICGLSLKHGGFVCEHDLHPGFDIRKSSYDLKIFRLLCKAGVQHYDALAPLNTIGYAQFVMLYAFFEEYAGVRVNSIRFLQNINNLDSMK